MVRGFYISFLLILAVVLYATLEKPEIYRLQSVTVSFATEGARFAERLEARAKHLGAELPRRVDSRTSLVEVRRRRDQLHFSFEVDRTSHPFKDLEFYRRTKERMTAELCFDPVSLKDLLDDVEYVYLFLNGKNAELAKVRVNIRDCLRSRRLG